MSSEPLYEEVFTIEGKDYLQGGAVSIVIKKILERFDYSPETVRRTAIIVYEAEMNITLYADRGQIKLMAFQEEIRLLIEDEGQGIIDIDLALQDGFSTATAEMREMGFGAGMGLPNIRRNSNQFSISSTVGTGTTLSITVQPKVEEHS